MLTKKQSLVHFFYRKSQTSNKKIASSAMPKLAITVQKNGREDLRKRDVGASLYPSAAPAFSEWNALVSDDLFRIDLPLLMLYLYTHKPTSLKFSKKPDGTVTQIEIDRLKIFYDRIAVL